MMKKKNTTQDLRHIKFMPPFGSSVRDAHDLSKQTVYDVPHEDMKIQDANKFYKQTMFKKSIRHSHENYEKFRDYFGEGVSLQVDSLSKYMFTNETNAFFKLNLLTGGIQARKITDLPKNNKHAKFFTKDVKIFSSNIPGHLYQLEPHMESVTIKNLKSDPLVVKDIMSNTPDCQVMIDDDDLSFPLKIEPG